MARRFAVGEAAQDLVRLEIAHDEDKPAGLVGVGPAFEPARRIERVLHGMDRRRTAGRSENSTSPLTRSSFSP